MGMYTHLHLDVEIYPVYRDIIEEYVDKEGRLRCTSYYFYDQGRNFIEVDPVARAINAPGIEPISENTSNMCVLHVDVSLKNYENEIEKFLEFLGDKVYAASSDIFYGFKRYENDELPTLILWNHETKKFEFKDVTING